MYRDFYRALVLNPENRTVSLKWPNVFDWFLRFFCIALFITVSVLTCKEIWRFDDKYLYAVGIMFSVLGLIWLYVTSRGYINTGMRAALASAASMSPTPVKWSNVMSVSYVLVATSVAGTIIWGVVEWTDLSSKWKVGCLTFLFFIGLLIDALRRWWGV